MSLTYSIGELVDVFDPKDEIFCPATVIGIVCAKDTRGVVKEVRIHYLGWDAAEWDENITDLSRLHPAGSYVIRCKSWVQLAGRMCHWPCFVYIRKPLPGSEIGMTHLRESKRLLIYPCGLFAAPLGPYKHGDGVWLNGTHISPYSTKQEDRTAAGLKTSYKVNFQAALKEMAEANSNLGESRPRILDFKFQLEGSLEVSEAKNKLKEEQRAETIRRQMAAADAKAEAEADAMRKNMKLARHLRALSKSGSPDDADVKIKMEMNRSVSGSGSVKAKAAVKLSNEEILKAIPDCIKENAVQTAAALKAIRQKHLKHKSARNKSDDGLDSDVASMATNDELWEFKISDFIPSLSPTSFYPLSIPLSNSLSHHAVSSDTSSSSSSSSVRNTAVATGGMHTWEDQDDSSHVRDTKIRRMRMLELSRDGGERVGITSSSSSSSSSISSKASSSSGDEKTSSSSSSSSSDLEMIVCSGDNDKGENEEEKEGDKERDVRNKRKRFQVTRYPPSGPAVLIPYSYPLQQQQHSRASAESAVEDTDEDVIILSPRARQKSIADIADLKEECTSSAANDNNDDNDNDASDDISVPQYW